MSNQFFEKTILNSRYAYPGRHWKFDPSGLPTLKIIEIRRRAEVLFPRSQAKKQKRADKQDALLFTDDLLDGKFQHGSIEMQRKH